MNLKRSPFAIQDKNFVFEKANMGFRADQQDPDLQNPPRKLVVGFLLLRIPYLPCECVAIKKTGLDE